MPLLLALLAPASAGPVFQSVDEETTLGMAGTWARLHPSADGWWFFQGAGGDYWAEDLAEDLTGYDDRSRIQLTDAGNLQDTQVERCDDGDWMVVGSATIDSFDDSAYAWRLDADFNPLGKVTIEEREDARAHNDMPLLCDTVATGVAYANGRGGSGATFFATDGVTLGGSTSISVNAMGGSLAVRPSDGDIVAAWVNGADSSSFTFTIFDASWSVVDEYTTPVPEGKAFWPQRLLPFGDGWILAYLASPNGNTGTSGDVWLASLDAHFVVTDSVQVSPDGTDNGRPWVSRHGDVLGVSYDRDVQPRIALVHLDDASVPDGEDLPDTGPSDDDTAGDDTDGSGGGGCGCGGGGSAAILALPLVFGARRRRS